MKLCSVIGVRPEIIKMAPLIPLLDQHFKHEFLFTSQHYSKNMVEIFLTEMKVRQPDEFLDVRSSDRELLESAIHETLARRKPELVVVYGDTNSTLAATRAAKRLGIKVCHLEAGLRSFDERMPEEYNRIQTDRLCDFHMAPTGLAKYFLTDYEGLPESGIRVVGNLVVDACLHFRPRMEEQPLLQKLAETPFCLLTLHRTENVDDPARLRNILDNLAQVPFPILLPVHPRTEQRMKQFGFDFPVNLCCMEPIGYLSFLRQLSACHVVLTDSGGIQEEAITLGVPCITLRDNTERMETVFLGANMLYDADHRRDLADFVAVMASRRESIRAIKNPYGDGHTAERIVTFIKENVG